MQESLTGAVDSVATMFYLIQLERWIPHQIDQESDDSTETMNDDDAPPMPVLQSDLSSTSFHCVSDCPSPIYGIKQWYIASFFKSQYIIMRLRVLEVHDFTWNFLPAL